MMTSLSCTLSLLFDDLGSDPRIAPTPPFALAPSLSSDVPDRPERQRVPLPPRPEHLAPLTTGISPPRADSMRVGVAGGASENE